MTRFPPNSQLLFFNKDNKCYVTALIGVQVLDHMIIAGHQCYSFAEHHGL